MAIARRRPRLRAGKTPTDPTTTLDLTGHDPVFALRTKAGKAQWKRLAADPPYWWDAADIPMVEVLCLATDAVAIAMQPGSASEAGRAAVLKEWRSLASELGMSPTSRSRLRLATAQGVVAAEKAEQMRSERDNDDEAEPMDLDLLDGDGQ